MLDESNDTQTKRKTKKRAIQLDTGFLHTTLCFVVSEQHLFFSLSNSAPLLLMECIATSFQGPFETSY